MNTETLDGRLAELRMALARLEEQTKSQMDSLQKQMELSKQVEALRSEVHQELSYFRWIGVSATIVIAVAGVVGGLVGYKSFSDYVGTVKQDVTVRLDRISSYYYDFSRANSLLLAKRWDEAIPPLIRCLEDNLYDESVLTWLLNAYDETERWEDAKDLIVRLKRDEKRYRQLKDPMTYNNMAVVQIGLGLDDQELLEEARRNLERARQLVAGDDREALSYINFNFWEYWVVKNDFEQAQQYVASLRGLPHPKDDWETAKKDWKIFRLYLSKNPTKERQVMAMWKQISSGTGPAWR